MSSRRDFVVGLVKDWGVATLIIALVIGAWFLLRSSGPMVGEPAPDFALQDLSGETVTLSDLRGETVVVNFWATWCGPCRSEIPELSEFQREHPEVRLLGVSVDENLGTPALAATSRRLGIDYTVLHDPRAVVASPYQISTLPTTIVIGPDGQVTDTVVGTVSKRRLERLTGVE